MEFLKKDIKNYLIGVAEIIISFVLFFAILSFVPSSKGAQGTLTEQKDMFFVLHGAASDWEMFFEENDLNDILTGDTKQHVLDMLNSEDGTGTINTGNINTGDISTGEINGVNIIEHKNPIITKCELPRAGDTIQDGEFVLAYEQRADVPSICNIERRICHNGYLDGSFEQRSCNDNVQYVYSKENVVLYNEKVTNSFIQTPKFASNKGVAVNTEGQVTSQDTQTTTRDNSQNNGYQQYNAGNGQVRSYGYDCVSPRGELVRDTHIVRAYKSNVGFLDQGCDVELRMCMDGNLEGTYRYSSCKYYEMTKQDYQMGKTQSDGPTPVHILDTLKQ